MTFDWERDLEQGTVVFQMEDLIRNAKSEPDGVD
jgi:hypothetical protein